jgi:hypothetical protein
MQRFGPTNASSFATSERRSIATSKRFGRVQPIPSRSRWSQKIALMSSERFENEYRD